MKYSGSLVWGAIQILVWIVGAGIVVSLVVFPELGMDIFWNLLIPVAPVLFVIIVGLWRNICPLASTSLIPEYLKLSKGRKLSLKWQGRLQLIGLISLLVLVPLRHVLFDVSPLATALLLIIVSIIALTLGFVYDAKSIWCSGLCPVYPAEKLYGTNVGFTLSNEHCAVCTSCVSPCVDSTAKITPLSVKKTRDFLFTGNLLVGGFAGFVLGWYLVPEFLGPSLLPNVVLAFAIPIGALIASFGIYWIVKKYIMKRNDMLLTGIFGALAIIIYYWYKLPALLGYTNLEGSILIDLTGSLPIWTPVFCRTIVIIFFIWWMVIRPKTGKRWSHRPPYAVK